MNKISKSNPNILLTEMCNRSCSYCFAKNKIATTEKKEMGLADLKKILDILEKNRRGEVRLMGGEPTLHSQFKKVIDLILSRGLKIRLFTNGFFPEKLAHWMTARGSSIKYTFNLTAVVFSPKSEKEVMERNLKILKKSSVICGNIIIDSTKLDNATLVNFIKINEIKFIRIGIANNMIPNYLTTISVQYEDAIAITMQLAKELKKAKVTHISLNCGFTPCMFQKQQIEQLKEDQIKINGWGCQGKLGAFDIATNLRIFPCFMAEDLKINDPSVLNSLDSARIFFKKFFRYLINFPSLATMNNCKKCYYFQKSQCTGPCIGYIKNNIDDNKILSEFKNSYSFKIIRKLLYIFRNWI